MPIPLPEMSDHDLLVLVVQNTNDLKANQVIIKDDVQKHGEDIASIKAICQERSQNNACLPSGISRKEKLLYRGGAGAGAVAVILYVLDIISKYLPKG